MSISSILDVAIGLVLIYYVLSLIVSYITSAIARWTEMRAKNLEQVLRGRLRDPETFDKFMNHPLVKNLQPIRSNWRGKVWEVKVTDIPAHAFVTTLFDILAPETPGQDKLEQLKQTVSNMPEGEIKRSLMPLVGTTVTDIQTARKNIEGWYNDIMQNVSNLYKQNARRIAIICALVVSIAVDADSLNIAKQLWDQPTLRAAATAKAEAYLNQAPNPDQTNVATYVSELQELRIPILWTMPLPTIWQGWAQKVFGWAITWLAIAQGSSFWYDVLRKIRSGGQPTATSPAKT